MKQYLIIQSLIVIIYFLISSCSNPLIKSEDKGQAIIQSDPSLDPSALVFKLSDLVDSQGISSNKGSPYISVTDSSSGKFRVEIDLKPSGYIAYGKVNFSIYLNSNTSDWMVNIGDSATNNGYGGDSSTQSNDCELQVMSNDLNIYANDYGNSAQLRYVDNWSANLPSIYFTIENNKVTYYGYYGTNAGEITSPYLFALNGQNDYEGPVNYKIYAAFNRVIANASRSGTGVDDVYISFSNPLPVNPYFGHLHNHSNISDGQGTPSQAYQYARDNAKLDFFGLGDHSNSTTSDEWTSLKSTANTYNSDGSFVTFWGFEWSSSGNYGHVLVTNTDDYCTHTAATTDTFAELVNWLNSRNGVAFLNHPGREDSNHQEFSHFTTTPSTKVVGMELWNKNETFSVFYNNDGYYTGDNNLNYLNEANTRGWKIGASGSDDNHTANWGNRNSYRMAVLSTEKTRSAILEGIQKRRFYSTLDKNLNVWMEIDGKPMGDSTSPKSPSTFIIRVSDPDKDMITNITMYKKGVPVLYLWPNTTYVYEKDSRATSIGDYYYIKVTEQDGDEAITSPIYIE